ncbi:diguanylate cyclase with GAF sensor [Cellulosilyticum lentocellum DSM 5427]|uniref:Diguanylate cyclase with GAF sensor n=2 Tax=Cellulosilyticum lentocellum TaxID=29360 RepID=F2JI74_CELLD|nr:diguanylate cyclase with GAF sensor [Cellulosilyticum lentocellum DSM 5427]
MSNEEVVMINKKKLEEQLDNIKKDPTYIDGFIALMTRSWGGDIEDNIEAIKGAISLIHKEEGKKAYIELLMLQAKYYFVLGKYSQGIEGLLDGVQILQEPKNEVEKHQLIQLQNMLLVGFTKKEEFALAIEYGLQGLEKAEALARPEIKVKLLLSILDLYIAIKAYKKAEFILQNIVAIDYILMDTTKLYIEIAWLKLFLCQKQFELAAEYSKRAYDLAKKNEEQYALELIQILSLRAKLNVSRELYAQAEKDFKDIKERIKKIRFKEIEEQSLFEWAKYDKKQGRMNEAIQKLKKIIEEQDESLIYVKESYKLLSEIYEETNEWQDAYRYLRKYEKSKENILDENVHKYFDKLNQINMTKEIEKYKLLYQDMQVLAQIGVALTEHLKPTVLNNKIYKQLSKLFKMDLFSILILDQEVPRYILVDHKGDIVKERKELIRNTEYLAEYCTKERIDISVSNGDFEAYHIKEIGEAEELQLQSVLFTPLIINDKAIGAVGIGSYKVNIFNSNDLNSLRVIASYLAITIQNTTLYHQAEYLGMHDSLTGLLNRGALLKQGEILFKKNHKQHKSTVVMMLDTDYFKQVNDRYGHQLGDEVLKKIGKILKKVVRKQDYVGRYGGEEFLVILDDLSEKEVVKVCQRIKKALSESCFETKKDTKIKVTVSGGFYICNEYTLNFSDAIQFADHALYRAKLLGRNRMISYCLGENES